MAKQLHSRDYDENNNPHDKTVYVGYDGSEDRIYFNPDDDPELVQFDSSESGRKLPLVAYDEIDGLIKALKMIKREMSQFN